MSEGDGNKEGDGDGNKGGRQAMAMAMNNEDNSGSGDGDEDYGGNSDDGGTYNNQLKVSAEEMAAAAGTETAMERATMTAMRQCQ